MQANALSTSACLLQTRQSESLSVSSSTPRTRLTGKRREEGKTCRRLRRRRRRRHGPISPPSVRRHSKKEQRRRTEVAPSPLCLDLCVVVQKKTKLRTGDFSRLGSSYEVKHQYIAHSPNSFASFARDSRQETSDMRGRQGFFYTEVKHFLSLLFLNEYFAEPDRRSLSYTYLRVSIYSASALL